MILLEPTNTITPFNVEIKPNFNQPVAEVSANPTLQEVLLPFRVCVAGNCLSIGSDNPDIRIVSSLAVKCQPVSVGRRYGCKEVNISAVDQRCDSAVETRVHKRAGIGFSPKRAVLSTCAHPKAEAVSCPIHAVQPKSIPGGRCFSPTRPGVRSQASGKHGNRVRRIGHVCYLRSDCERLLLRKRVAKA
jgi:hypothetical protein